MNKSLYLILLATTLITLGCGPNQRIIDSGRENPPLDRANANVAPAKSSFDSDIESMRTADFYNIYVFRRKDSAPLHGEDKAFLAANLPGEVNRRILSDEGKALIAGSNFKLPDDTWLKLKERFAFEDFSTPSPDAPGAKSTSNKS